MAFTAFVSKSKPGNQVHNERAFDADHPEPDYFLPPEHRQENIYIKTGLTDKRVYRDYVRTTDYGRKTGRLHHSAKPVREAIIVCKMDTTEAEVRTLIEKLESGLGIRALHAHVHKDEGHIDKKTGQVKHNPHIHFGYSNLVIEDRPDETRPGKTRRHGRLTDMNKERMSKAQDICAEALGMERAPHYTKETRKKNLPHQVYRAKQETEAKVEAALDAAEEKTAGAEARAEDAEQKVIDLVAENKRLREELKASGIATRKDYMTLAEIKKSDLDQDEKVLRMVQHVERVLEANAPGPEELGTAPAPVPTITDELVLWREKIIEDRDKDWQKWLKPYLDVLGKLPKALHAAFNALLPKLAGNLAQEHQFSEGLQSTPDRKLVELRDTLEEEWLDRDKALSRELSPSVRVTYLEHQERDGKKLLALWAELDQRAITAREHRKPIPPFSKHRETILELMQSYNNAPEPPRGHGMEY